MKKVILILIAALITIPAFAQTRVNGYYKKNGTYVQPHYRSNRDNNPYNNYSTKGNVNPYTGKHGSTQPNPYYGSRIRRVNTFGL